MPVTDTRPRTLAGVIDALSADNDLSKPEKTELTSAVRTFSRCVGRNPSEIDANPVAIRALARYAKPKLAEVSEAHFKNTMSRLTRAMLRVGVPVDRRRTMPLSGAWATLLATLPEMKRLELRKFAGWCSARNLDPGAVQKTSFAEYFEFLEQQSVQHNLRERWRRAWRVWNEVVAVEGSGYQHIGSIFDDRERLISLRDLPPAFASELKQFRDALTRPSIFGGASKGTSAVSTFAERLKGGRRKPLSPVTAEGYARNLVLLVGYLVKDGVSPEYFTTLPKLVDPELMLRGLERIQSDILAERARKRSAPTGRMDVPPGEDPNEPVPIVTGVAFAVLSLAKYSKAEPDTLKAIGQMASATKVKRVGMTQKNKTRLNQLADPRAKRLLHTLPIAVFARHDDVDKATFKQAREVQNAAILAVLLEVPLRVMNVAHLDLDRHFQRPVTPGAGKWLACIPAHEVKNDIDIDSEFSEATSALLDRYVAVFRPALSENHSSALFPSRTGQAKRRTTVSTQFKEFIRRETGLVLNAHLMRHVAATNWLDAHPEDAETARQLLGHRSVDTTRKFYSGLDQRRSYRRYHELLEDVRREPSDIPKPTFNFGRRRKGGLK